MCKCHPRADRTPNIALDRGSQRLSLFRQRPTSDEPSTLSCACFQRLSSHNPAVTSPVTREKNVSGSVDKTPTCKFLVFPVRSPQSQPHASGTASVVSFQWPSLGHGNRQRLADAMPAFQTHFVQIKTARWHINVFQTAVRCSAIRGGALLAGHCTVTCSFLQIAGNRKEASCPARDPETQPTRTVFCETYLLPKARPTRPEPKEKRDLEGSARSLGHRLALDSASDAAAGRLCRESLESPRFLALSLLFPIPSNSSSPRSSAFAHPFVRKLRSQEPPVTVLSLSVPFSPLQFSETALPTPPPGSRLKIGPVQCCLALP